MSALRKLRLHLRPEDINMANNPRDTTLSWLRKDLSDNAGFVMRTMSAMAAYTGLGGEAVEKAKAAIVNVLKEFQVEIIDQATPVAKNLYGRLRAREAAALDMLLFGENRTIQEIQNHVYELGLERSARTDPATGQEVSGKGGQVRSAIKSVSNINVYFTVTEDDRVSLTEKGLELATKLRRSIPNY